MQRYFSIVLILILFFSCNKIENHKSLNQEDITFIKSLKLLEGDETIYKFYSENTNETAGNFFTNRRVATYWIDKRNAERNETNSAFFNEIIKIDAVYKAGPTYCPYAVITRKDGSNFKVYVDGNKKEIKLFFKDLIFEWKKKRTK